MQLAILEFAQQRAEQLPHPPAPGSPLKGRASEGGRVAVAEVGACPESVQVGVEQWVGVGRRWRELVRA